MLNHLSPHIPPVLQYARVWRRTTGFDFKIGQCLVDLGLLQLAFRLLWRPAGGQRPVRPSCRRGGHRIPLGRTSLGLGSLRFSSVPYNSMRLVVLEGNQPTKGACGCHIYIYIHVYFAEGCSNGRDQSCHKSHSETCKTVLLQGSLTSDWFPPTGSLRLVPRRLVPLRLVPLRLATRPQVVLFASVLEEFTTIQWMAIEQVRYIVCSFHLNVHSPVKLSTMWQPLCLFGLLPCLVYEHSSQHVSPTSTFLAESQYILCFVRSCDLLPDTAQPGWPERCKHQLKLAGMPENWSSAGRVLFSLRLALLNFGVLCSFVGTEHGQQKRTCRWIGSRPGSNGATRCPRLGVGRILGISCFRGMSLREFESCPEMNAWRGSR